MGRLEELQQLSKLKESGAITEEEFTLEKGKILQNFSNNNNEGNNSGKEGKAFIGFILGLCSIIAWFLPIIGLPVTVIGIIFSSLGLSSAKRGQAVAGLILSIIFLVVTVINSIAGVMMTSFWY